MSAEVKESHSTGMQLRRACLYSGGTAEDDVSRGSSTTAQ